MSRNPTILKSSHKLVAITGGASYSVQRPLGENSISTLNFLSMFLLCSYHIIRNKTHLFPYFTLFYMFRIVSDSRYILFTVSIGLIVYYYLFHLSFITDV